jgi:hypothetical protein
MTKKQKFTLFAIPITAITLCWCIFLGCAFTNVVLRGFGVLPSWTSSPTRVSIGVSQTHLKTLTLTPTLEPTSTLTPTITQTSTSTITLTPLPSDLLTATSVAATEVAINSGKTATQEVKFSAATGTSMAITATAESKNAARTVTQAAKNSAATATSLVKTKTKSAINATATELASYKEISWRELSTYPDDHIGEKVIVRGVIMNVVSKSEFQIFFSGTYEPCYIVMLGEYSGIYKDVSVVVYGTVYGKVCGTNAFGVEICQPSIIGFYFGK